MTSFTQKILLAAILFCSINIVYAATHTVTNGTDYDFGSLKRTIQIANSGDTIVFAPDVNYITLTSGQIRINKNLTIDGGSDTTQKVTIDGNDNSRIFEITASHTVDINNLVFTKGNSGEYGGGAIRINEKVVFSATNCDFIGNFSGQHGGAIYVANLTTTTIINCTFTQNIANISGGAIFLIGSFMLSSIRQYLTVINCTFTQNTANGHNGGAIAVPTIYNCIFIAKNCTFTQNTANRNGGAISNDSHSIIENCTFFGNTANEGGAINNGTLFIATNCTFSHNTANIGGAIHHGKTWTPEPLYLYHCTFDNNDANANRSGGGIYINRGSIYSYNCLFTGNTPDHIRGTFTDGNNLFDGENGVTRNLVFGNNMLTDSGYIMPLEFAKTATRLTNTSNIQVPEEIMISGIQIFSGITVAEILAILAKDQRGKDRPETGFVTFGAVEYDESSINELIKLNTVNIFPNPASNYFTVSFELEKANNMRIVLLDLSGRELLHIYDGFTVEGNFTTTVDTEHLASGVYFLQILIDGNIGVAKVIVE